MIALVTPQIMTTSVFICLQLTHREGADLHPLIETPHFNTQHFNVLFQGYIKLANTVVIKRIKYYTHC